MKPWVTVALIGIAILGIVYIYLHRQEFGLVRPEARVTGEEVIPGPNPGSSSHASIVWERVDRSANGFKVEMPSGIKEIQVPASNERGGSEQVQMIYSNPDPETTFSVAWEDNPPVARVNGMSADRTLEMARDDALSRTQTTLVSESRSNPDGLPGRDLLARNAGGGILNARLIYARPRLYMLTAAYPSANARREQDVNRFFDSFHVTSFNRLRENM